MADDINGANYKIVRMQIAKWEQYRSNIPMPKRYMQLAKDLYDLRNDKVVFPEGMGHDDDVINASVEHYFLCRSLIGNGIYPAWEVVQMANLYNAGKKLGLTPRHNKNKPVSPPSEMQKYFQQRGIDDGIDDSILYDVDKPLFPRMPPMYY